MTVFRRTPLPVAKSRGRLIVPATVADQTRSVLRQFSGMDGPHEGLLYWLGRRERDDSIIVAACVPRSDHGPQRVMVSEREVGRMSRRARQLGLTVVTQVHSHPGNDTRHSEGDDYLILMPTEGMFSLVVGSYGAGGTHPSEGAGLHQYQDKRWVQIPVDQGDAMILVPSVLDFRND